MLKLIFKINNHFTGVIIENDFEYEEPKSSFANNQYCLYGKTLDHYSATIADRVSVTIRKKGNITRITFQQNPSSETTSFHSNYKKINPSAVEGNKNDLMDFPQ